MTSKPHAQSQTTRHGTPRWVKLFALIAVGLALLAVVVAFTAGGPHGPWRHLPSAVSDGNMSGLGQP